MPRAALLSIHARVEGTEPTTWEDPSLVQLWGPRFSAYVVAASDIGLFTLARLPDGGAARTRATDTAARLHAMLDGRRMAYGEAGRALGQSHNSLRYGAPTGTILIRWDGARQPTIWTVPPPEIEPHDARLEIARRYLHLLGPTTPEAFAGWLGIKPPVGRATFDALGAVEGSLTPVTTPIGEAWILASDEASFRGGPRAAAEAPGPSEPLVTARLLPSGDAYYLLWGADRELLVPEPDRRAALWTSRVWPGAVLVGGEIVGTWRRANADVSIEPWRRLSARERDAIQAEAGSLPLSGLVGRSVFGGAAEATPTRTA